MRREYRQASPARVVCKTILGVQTSGKRRQNANIALKVKRTQLSQVRSLHSNSPLQFSMFGSGNTLATPDQGIQLPGKKRHFVNIASKAKWAELGQVQFWAWDSPLETIDVRAWQHSGNALPPEGVSGNEHARGGSKSVPLDHPTKIFDFP